jgi:cysteine desulfurase/selenocysteine lyase
MTLAPAAIDFETLRRDFPILETEVGGRPIAYLDNAATSQKPAQVLKQVDEFWRTKNANVHRGVHYLSQLATSAYEEARASTRKLLNAGSDQEVVFTRGCTESINMVASGLSSGGSPTGTRPGGTWLKAGDVILVSEMEHHSNIVPWQMAAVRSGAEVKVIPITDQGEIDRDAYSKLLRENPVKVVAINHVSNSLGTINPVKQLIAEAHQEGARVMVDGAQAGPHLRIDVRDLDADYYSLSCHKIYAPTGVGVLYGKRELLEELPPLLGGGDMVRTVSFARGTSYAALPAKLEAGTPNVGGVVGLGAAVEYLSSLSDSLESSFEQIGRREAELANRAIAGLRDIPGLRIWGNSPDKAGIVSFTLESVHPHDIGTILDTEGVAVRAGHHCCMPVMERYGIPATVRASFAFYNTAAEADRLVSGVRKVREMFAR